MRVQFLGREDRLGWEMATHSSLLAWRRAWTEEPGRLQSTGLQRVGHKRACTHYEEDGLRTVIRFGLVWCVHE